MKKMKNLYQKEVKRMKTLEIIILRRKNEVESLDRKMEIN
jgi:hypothetical protein